MLLKKIGIYAVIGIVLIGISFFAGSITTKHRLVEQHRLELELARTRSEQYEAVYRSARETNRELGECLSRSATTLSGLREQLHEIRKRYEEMENLLNSAGDIGTNVSRSTNN